MAGIDKVPQRQLDLGAASWFFPRAAGPPSNQVVVGPGFLYQGGFRVLDKYTGGDQLTPGGFASVVPGNQRYDLVYLDGAGVVQVAQGTQVALATPVYQGAPGFTGGPDLPDPAVPVAYVLVTDVGVPVITDARITPITGFIHAGKTLRGHYVDKGAFGGAPTGTSTIVTAMFAGETGGGSGTVRGVITTAPSNVVEILDQNFKEILHVQGFRIYGRLTLALGVWTLAYFYLDATGTEQALANIATLCTVVPSNLRLYRVPKVYSTNETTRPLFEDAVAVQRRFMRAANATGEVPIGGMIEWSGDTSGSPPALPTGWEWADGTVVATANSRKVGQAKPIRMKTAAGGAQRFGRGADYSAGAHGGGTADPVGGTDTIPNDSPGTDTVGGATPFAGTITATTSNTSVAHTHTNSDTGATVNDGAGPLGYQGLVTGGGPNAAMHHHTNSATGGMSGNDPHNHSIVAAPFSGTINTAHAHTVDPHDHGGENRPAFQDVAVIMRVL